MKKNMKSILSVVALLSLTAMAATAQVDKKIEVTRTYIPEIKTATKIHLTPDTSDDSYIEPDIDYSITPISIETKLESEVYKPVKVSFVEYDSSKKYYLKMGVGAPLRSDFDLYATPINNSQGYLMGYFNQDGEYAKIRNDYGERNGSSNSHFRTGVAGGKYVGSRVLESNLEYNNDLWSRYATKTLEDTHPLYQSVDFDLRFGDNFSSLDFWNYSLGGEVDHFWSRSNYENTTFGVDGILGRELFEGEVIIGAGYDQNMGSMDYRNGTLSVLASYKYDCGTWGVKVGLEYLSDMISSDYMKRNQSSYLLPDFKLQYQLNKRKFIAYTSAKGELHHTDFATLSEENPYLAPGLYSDRSEVEYDIRLGLCGSLAQGRFGYNIYGAYGVVLNNIYWALTEQFAGVGVNNYFTLDRSTMHRTSGVVELQYKPNSRLLFDMAFMASGYSNDKHQIYEDGMPCVEMELGAEYRVKRWSFGVDGELLTSRKSSVIYVDDMANEYLTSVKIPTAFDLGVDFSYRARESFVIYGELTNLLNQDIYEWVGYRGYGMGGMLGVRLEF